MKILYVSSILMDNSFGEVSKKYIQMFKKYNNKHDIYLFNINMAFDKYDNTDFLNNNKHIKDLFVIIKPNNYDNLESHIKSNLIYGIYDINKYILQVNPDIVIILFNDSNICNLSFIVDEIRDKWKGLYVPLVPIDFQNQLKHIYQVNYDACITLNEWSKQEIESIPNINYPVYHKSHIVDGFFTIDDNELLLKYKKDIYGEENMDKYIIGCVNANNGRKRLDLVVKAFIEYYKTDKNSILFLKTTKYDENDLLAHFQLEKFTKDYPIIICIEYMSYEKLNILYNTFDIMINPTDGEGFGLTPFECALAGTLTILPHNSSFNSLIIDDKIPEYIVPCKFYPYEYIRNFPEISPILNGQNFFSFFYDFKHFKDITQISQSFIPINNNAYSYIITKKNSSNNKNIFNDIETILKQDWSFPEIQILCTSDIESLRYVLGWLTINQNYKFPGINRSKLIMNTKSLENFIGTDTPRVGIVNTNDICEKIKYYKSNQSKYKKDLNDLQSFIKKNYSQEKVWNTFDKIMNDIYPLIKT